MSATERQRPPDDPAESPRRRRRHVVGALGIVAVGFLLLVAVTGAIWEASDDADLPTHPPSSVEGLPAPVEWLWAGGATADRAQVVAKVEGDAAVRLLVAPDGGLGGFERIEGVPTDAGDGTVARFDVDGLTADQEYHYALEVDGEAVVDASGRFRTMPEGPSSFTVAVSSCARTGSNGAVFDAIRERAPLLYINTGDLHYGDITADDPEAFREVLDTTLSAPAQSALYRSTSTAYVWDDHDFGGNNSDRASASKPAAQRVYREYVPHYPLGEAASTDGGIYQSQVVGRVRVVLSDLRSYRSPQEMVDGPRKTMLGDEQLRWLEDELRAAADAGQVVLWVSSTPWIGAPEAGEDDWAGYTHERGLVADMISDLGLTDQLVMVGGDAHMVALDDGANSDYSTGRTGGFPVLHAGALDQDGSIKGGPYSGGSYPGGGQFGEVEVRDDGDTVEVVLRGMAYDGRVIVEETFDVTPTR